MIVWDYMVAAASWVADGDDSVELGLLNAHGAKGWELVSVDPLSRYGAEVHYRYVFKRPRAEVSEGASGLLNLAAKLEAHSLEEQEASGVNPHYPRTTDTEGEGL